MPSCELCGRSMKSRGHETIIEGALMLLCPDCAKRFGGKSLNPRSETMKPSQHHLSKRPQLHSPVRMKRKQIHKKALIRDTAATLDEMILIEDYAEKIRRARQKAGLSQEELAQRIGEKFSTLQGIEAGRLKPTKRTIRGLERELKISLLEPISPVPIKTAKEINAHGPTLGDVVKIKRKKSS